MAAPCNWVAIGLPVKLCMMTGSGGVGRPSPSSTVLRLRSICATDRWSAWSARTSSRLSSSCLQCSCTSVREWSRPRNAMWSISGTWIDQSTSTTSTTTSVSSITATLHLPQNGQTWTHHRAELALHRQDQGGSRRWVRGYSQVRLIVTKDTNL